MSFRIKPDCSSPDEIRRLAGRRLEKAIAALQDGSAEGIHDARKRLKETRALLRLVRQSLGKGRFKALNATLRDSARQLSAQRDASALVECWDALIAHCPARFADPAFSAVRQRLVERTGNEPTDTPLAPVIDTLRQVSDGIACWPLRRQGFALWAKGLQRSYQDGCHALRAVRRQPSDEALHEWRKRAKDHWYQTRLLEHAWPALFKARKRELKRLADYLGDDHDLALLQTLLAEQPALVDDDDTRAALAEAIATRRAVLQAQALTLGARVYAEAPKALVSRWRAYWKVAAASH